MSSIVKVERQQIVNYFPLFIVIGIFCRNYFQIHFIPHILAASLLLLAIKRGSNLAYFLLILVTILAGYVSMDYRIYRLASPVIPYSGEFLIDGTITEIHKQEKGYRIMIENLDIGLPRQETPKKIRMHTRAKNRDFEIGDKIIGYGKIMPPGGQLLHDTFDFAEYAYFKQIGGVGYMEPEYHIVGHVKRYYFSLFLESIRVKVAEKISASMRPAEAGVAIGLLVGDSSYILNAVFEDLRISGIAHLVAISGMHMIIVVSIFFISTRFLLSRVEYITLRWNIKKIAAIFGIIFSYCYLILVGMPLSAQRAFFLSSLVLLGILFDRQTISMRSLMLSASVILLCMPESIKSPSLQMSFIACISLIALHDRYGMLIELMLVRLPKRLRYSAKIVIATMMASAATTPFLLYHFNQFSTYGVLTNVLAIPLNDFFIMVLGIVSLALMPFGAEWLALKPMSFFISILLKIAHYVSVMKYSCVHSNYLSGVGLLVIAVAYILFCIIQVKWRNLMLLVMLAGMFWGKRAPYGDIILSPGGELFVIKNEDAFYFSDVRKNKHIVKIFTQALAQQQALNIASLEDEECNKHFCKRHGPGGDFHIITHPDFLQVACKKGVTYINLYNDAKCSVSELNITKSEITNTISFYFSLH